MARLSDDLGSNSKPPFRATLTVSHEAGARAVPVCELLADYVGEEDESAEWGWTLLDRDLVAQIIGDSRLSGLVEKRIATDPGIAKTVPAGVPDTPPSEWTPILRTADVIRKLARLGSTIIIGCGGNFITADLNNAFHIRLVGTESKRCAYLQRTRNLDRECAASYMQLTDREEREFVASHFHKDVADPLGYDAVIRTDDLSDEVLARMIGDFLMDWVFANAATAGKLVPMS